MIRVTATLTCLAVLLAAPRPVPAMGDLIEPAIDEEIKDTMQSMEGTIVGLNLDSEPPLIRIVNKKGKSVTMMMNGSTTSVWINEKLKRIRHLRLGDEIKMYYLVQDRKGIVTGVEVTARAAKAGSEGGSGGNVMDDLKALKKGQKGPRMAPARPPAMPVNARPVTPTGVRAPTGAPSVPVTPVTKPVMPAPVTATQERRTPVR